MGLQIGDGAPVFCLPDSAGEDTCLDQYRGRWVILFFYPRDSTPGCTREALQFEAELPSFTEHGAAVIGVSPDSMESHRRFQDRHRLHIRLLSDPDHLSMQPYGVWKPKVLFGREILGVERSTFLINPQGKIAAIWRKVRVLGHAAAVLASLKKQGIP